MSTPAAVPPPAAPVREGDVLASKYRVEKVLGAGGMGIVVAATHIELEERVALKFLLPQAASNEELVERFLREARASVRLKGKHVAKTLDVGRLADNCPYIVMEFLDGHDLHTEIRAAHAGQTALTVQNAISYVLQAAEGLAEAHSRGIVHRDLKPGNLFLTRGVDGHPLVKVLDFGISKTLDTGAGSEGLSLTRTEMLLGSPLYMSPEQMRSSKHVDERSDLWALGAIAYELLTGKVPFEADSILELCFKVAQEAPPSPQTFRPDLPDELCTAILRCLAKLPEERFGNVAELAEALEPFGLDRDRGTAARARDVLGTGKRTPRTSQPSAPNLDMYALPRTPAPTPSPISSPGIGSASGTSSAEMRARESAERDSGHAAPISVSVDGGAPNIAAAATVAEGSQPGVRPLGVEPPLRSDPAPQAWGTTSSQPRPKSRKGLLAAIGGGAALLAVIVGLAVTRHPAPPDGAAAANANGLVAAPSPSVSTAVSPSGAAPLGTVAPVAAPTPEAPASAASAVVAAPATAATAKRPAGVVGKPPGASGAAVAAASASATPAKSAKPAASAPAADPGGFIKVRE